ncbi:MAG: polyribonucleotide nucleotidyltransferase [Candidatus Omnitrophota bacterium]|nr:MAG: polyribonucleotide nucleotidyltransferase [Candidatus Omnitrophota bacterium]
MTPLQVKVNTPSGEIILETGKLASQANGAVTVQLKGTVVLVTACMSKEAQDTDFFPLTVDYQEKTYAAGKIPGGFFKREGKPKEIEILSARVVDRSIRPLFPSELRNSVQIVCVVLSSDAENDPDVLAINGASAALTISDIPFQEPVGAIRVGRNSQGFIINPTYAQREASPLDIIVTANKEKILMIEAKADQEKEEVILEAIKFAHNYIKDLITAQEELRKKVGREKVVPQLFKVEPSILNNIKEEITPFLEELYKKETKEERFQLRKELLEKLKEKEEFKDIEESLLKYGLEKLEKEFVRKKILTEKIRPDKRKPSELRPIWCEVGVLPRTHGSAIFTRGQTQSLAVTTLGTTSDEQMIEALEGQTFKHFMLHYSFPPFSVGEVSPLRAPSRREIGHGALAEKALEAVIPKKDRFPYTIRVVSEILESNGSSSMASVCAATLSLMDAGVPIQEPVAGIALGLIKEENQHLILVDIAGIEDHSGDMDFKIAGTKKGITAIQLDLKISGIDYPLIQEALSKALEVRLQILEKMLKTLAKPRTNISEYAPKIKTLKINPEKIGELIGPGGRTIRKIINQAEVSVDIDDEKGEVTISAETQEALEKGMKMIEEITQDLEVGKVYTAKVTRITSFGAFCEIKPGKLGLLHISEISPNFVKNVSDYLKEGDVIKVKILQIDQQGKITLSKKQADEENR